MNAPLRPPRGLQRLAWLTDCEIKCRKIFFHPSDPVMFIPGESYPLKAQIVRVNWDERKPRSTGNPEHTELTGFESAFVVKDHSNVERWFLEARLGRNVQLRNVTDLDFTLQDLIEHFEVPDVPTIAEQKPEEYLNARTRLLFLTTP